MGKLPSSFPNKSSIVGTALEEDDEGIEEDDEDDDDILPCDIVLL